MRRDEISLGHAASDLARGELSRAEDELAGEAPEQGLLRAQHEDWLYFHLTVARAALVAMESARPLGATYIAKHRERSNALARASVHYLKLLDMGGVPPLLADMVLAEGGLTP